MHANPAFSTTADGRLLSGLARAETITAVMLAAFADGWPTIGRSTESDETALISETLLAAARGGRGLSLVSICALSSALARLGGTPAVLLAARSIMDTDKWSHGRKTLLQ